MKFINGIMEILREKLPMVEWDRYIECLPESDEENWTIYDIYGWVPNQRHGRDFVYIMAKSRRNEVDWLVFVTSSAKYSEQMHERLFGSSEGHRKCKKIPAPKLDQNL